MQPVSFSTIFPFSIDSISFIVCSDIWANFSSKAFFNRLLMAPNFAYVFSSFSFGGSGTGSAFYDSSPILYFYEGFYGSDFLIY